jgi:alkyl hydroperoxide reductase subunit AhpC
MTLQLGDVAPDFTAPSTIGPLNLYNYLGESWGILFSHPRDFTPVCSTELAAIAKAHPEFERRETKVLGLSVDSLESHESWIRDIERSQRVTIDFPMIADTDGSVSTAYGMIHPNADNTLTVRSVFVIAPDKQVKLTISYPSSTGRNFDEILRALDSLQLTANFQLATPANWARGEDVIITLAVSDAEAAGAFPGYKTVMPYLRTTKDPTLARNKSRPL